MEIINKHVMISRHSALYGAWEECQACGFELINGRWYKQSDDGSSCEPSAKAPECTGPAAPYDSPEMNDKTYGFRFIVHHGTNELERSVHGYKSLADAIEGMKVTTEKEIQGGNKVSGFEIYAEHSIVKYR